MATSSAVSPAAGSASVSQLFSDVQRFFRDEEDYEKALRTIEKILHSDPRNTKALHCKAVCLIRSGDFAAALTVIESIDVPQVAANVSFEKAYCLYRLNRVQEALDLMQGLDSSEHRVKELMAQSLYRLERFEESYALYVHLIKNSTDDCDDERETNLSAVMACMSLAAAADATGGGTGSTAGKAEIGEQTYELCYNKACIRIGDKDWDGASVLLDKAQDLCVQVMREEEATDEDIDRELAIIKSQRAFVTQVTGKEKQAASLYAQVLKSRPEDSAVVAVVSNNIVVLNKEQNVFDSKKKIRSAMSEEAKLTSLHKKTIAVNHCLFLLATGQQDSCRKSVHELRSKFPDIEAADVIEAAILVKEKDIGKAITVLQSVTKRSLNVSLSLANLLIKAGRVRDAISELRNLGPDSQRLAIVSLIVSLYQSLDQKDSAVNVLKEAIDWHKRQGTQESLIILYRETSRLLMSQSRPQEAAAILSQQRLLTPDSPRLIAQLIAAYAQFDEAKAEETMKSLPPIDSIIESVDVDALEESNWSLGAKYVRKTVKGAENTDPKAKSKNSDKKKKRKRKSYRGKNYDANVDPDPERWLPKWQRTTFKRKKDKRKNTDAIGKGSQGAVGDASATETKVMSPKAGHQQSSTTPLSPQPQKQQVWQKKKRSKR